MIVGIGLVFIGLSMAIPKFGGFGILWTLLAVGITAVSAVNVFTERGVAQGVVEFDSPVRRLGGPAGESIEARLEKLEELRRNGLVSGAEYLEQRHRILNGL